VSDTEHKCHCSHVVVVVNDLKRMERLAWIVVVALVGVLVHRVTNAMGAHEGGAAPVWRQGERLAPDRIDEPAR